MLPVSRILVWEWELSKIEGPELPKYFEGKRVGTRSAIVARLTVVHLFYNTRLQILSLIEVEDARLSLTLGFFGTQIDIFSSIGLELQTPS